MQVTHCGDGHQGLARACTGGDEVIVLDIMRPGRDGLSVLKALREAGVPTPVTLLAARIHVLRRRLSGERQNTVQVGSFTLDRITRQAPCRGTAIEPPRASSACSRS